MSNSTKIAKSVNIIGVAYWYPEEECMEFKIHRAVVQEGYVFVTSFGEFEVYTKEEVPEIPYKNDESGMNPDYEYFWKSLVDMGYDVDEIDMDAFVGIK